MSSIFNRRNALIGWAVWTLVRQQAKRRAKRAVTVDAGSGSGWRGKVVALGLGVATAAGLVFVWRKLRGGGDEWQVPVEAPTTDGAEPTPLGTVREDDIPPAA